MVFLQITSHYRKLFFHRNNNNSSIHISFVLILVCCSLDILYRRVGVLLLQSFLYFKNCKVKTKIVLYIHFFLALLLCLFFILFYFLFIFVISYQFYHFDYTYINILKYVLNKTKKPTTTTL